MSKKNRYWTTDTCEEAAHAIEQQYCEIVDDHENKESAVPLTCLPSLDYELPNGKRGCTAIAGGDHGDIAFRFHWQFQLMSTELRKKNRTICCWAVNWRKLATSNEKKTSSRYWKKQSSQS